ncbi:MAG: hypothetical protein ACK5Z5_02725 [Neisseriaceae bacterium]
MEPTLNLKPHQSQVVIPAKVQEQGSETQNVSNFQPKPKFNSTQIKNLNHKLPVKPDSYNPQNNWLIDHDQKGMANYAHEFQSISGQGLKEYLGQNRCTIFFDNNKVKSDPNQLSSLNCNILTNKGNTEEWHRARHYSAVIEPALTQSMQNIDIISLPGINFARKYTDPSKSDCSRLDVNPKDNNSIKQEYKHKFDLLINAAIYNGNKKLIMTPLGMGFFTGNNQQINNTILDAFIDVFNSVKELVATKGLSISFSDYDGRYTSALQKHGIEVINGDLADHINKNIKSEDKCAVLSPCGAEQIGQHFIDQPDSGLEASLRSKLLTVPYDVRYTIAPKTIACAEANNSATQEQIAKVGGGTTTYNRSSSFYESTDSKPATTTKTTTTTSSSLSAVKDVSSSTINAETTQAINNAFFIPNESDKPIKLKINAAAFNYIKGEYLNKLKAVNPKNEIVNKHIEYVESLSFAYAGNEDIELTVYPAYSKRQTQIGHNISGDTSLEIRLPNGELFEFVFDAPSMFGGFDMKLLNCLGREIPGDTLLTMNAKLLYLLTKCSKKEFLDKTERDSLDYEDVRRAISRGVPYVELSNSDGIKQLEIQGDCNALILYDGNFVTLSAGMLSDEGDAYQEELNDFYKSINWQISSFEQLNKIIEINSKYQDKNKSYSNPYGGFQGQILSITGDLKDLPIILVSDGITDNMEFFQDNLNAYMDNPTEENFSLFMNDVKGYMVDLASGNKKQYKNTKSDDLGFIFSKIK